MKKQKFLRAVRNIHKVFQVRNMFLLISILFKITMLML